MHRVHRSDQDLWCPFGSEISPHAADVDRGALAWARKFGLIKWNEPPASARSFEYGALAARAYPKAEKERLQIAADWVSWLFLMDDECDETGVGGDPELLMCVHERLLAVLRGAPPCTNDHQLVHSLHDLRMRMVECDPSAWLSRFAYAVEEYFAANRWEARNRMLGVIPSVSDYQAMRAHTGAVFACFELTQITDGIRLPAEVRRDAGVQRLALLANCTICWCNDILSASKEARQGDVHNLVIVLKNERRLSDDEAVREAVRVHNGTVRAFVEQAVALESFGAEVDAELSRYVACLRSWMRANLDWSWTALRYRRAMAGSSEGLSFALPEVSFAES
ncbi:terpene synthase family protein [Sorangium sp. So ce1000]|uniref:terpene synthase family protein n=1 Tax=Sorangium sp. So ce1000 TaxID=3133325 RepID=UPI003F6432E7